MDDVKLQQIKQLFDQKLGARKISQQLGITRWAAQQAYKELGIYNIGRKTPKKEIPNSKQNILDGVKRTRHKTI